MKILMRKEWIGEKKTTSVRLGEKLMALVRERAEETGTPITRILEDALILYLDCSIPNTGEALSALTENVEINHACNLALWSLADRVG